MRSSVNPETTPHNLLCYARPSTLAGTAPSGGDDGGVPQHVCSVKPLPQQFFHFSSQQARCHNPLPHAVPDPPPRCSKIRRFGLGGLGWYLPSMTYYNHLLPTTTFYPPPTHNLLPTTYHSMLTTCYILPIT